MAQKITEAKLRRLKANPPKTRKSIQEEGLRVEVNPTGRIVFFAPYYQHGQKHKDKIGTYPAMSAAEARKAVLHLRHQREVQEVNIKQSTENFLTFMEGDFKAWCEVERKDGEATMKRLRHQFSKTAIARTKLKDVTSQMVERYKLDCLKAGQAPATITRNLGDLSRVFSKAVEWELIKRNPVSKVSRPKPDRKKEIRYLADTELSRLDAALNTWEDSAHYKHGNERRRFPTYFPYFVRVAVNTGMRRGEILSLRWQDIDDERGFITVRGSIAKGHTTRRIPISDKLANELREMRSAAGPEYMRDSTRVFPVRSIKRPWDRLRKLAELEHIRFHDLRHNFASQLVLRGAALTKVQKLMGHTDIKTTSIYLDVRDEELIEAVNLL